MKKIDFPPDHFLENSENYIEPVLWDWSGHRAYCWMQYHATDEDWIRTTDLTGKSIY